MDSIKVRINKVLTYTGLNANELAKALNYSRAQKIYNLINERNDFSREIIKDITTKFEKINPEYLLTGVGTLIKKPEKNSVENTEFLEQEIEKKNAEIQALKDQIVKMLMEKR